MPANGSDFARDDVCGFQDVNEIKNSYRSATPPTTPVRGLLWEDTGGPTFKVYDGGWSAITATAGQALDGMIIPWVGGYFGAADNTAYTYVKGSANTIAGANSYLNPLGWWVCDGTVPNEGTSGIWNAAGRYLPNLTDNRFVQGSTLTGAIGGVNTNSHTHDCDPSSTTSGGVSAAVEVNYQVGAPAQATGHTHDCDLDNTASGVASETENRPQFLACLYIVKVK